MTTARKHSHGTFNNLYHQQNILPFLLPWTLSLSHLRNSWHVMGVILPLTWQDVWIKWDNTACLYSGDPGTHAYWSKGERHSRAIQPKRFMKDPLHTTVSRGMSFNHLEVSTVKSQANFRTLKVTWCSNRVWWVLRGLWGVALNPSISVLNLIWTTTESHWREWF